MRALWLMVALSGCTYRLALERTEFDIAVAVADHRQQQREADWDAVTHGTPTGLTAEDVRSLRGFYDLHAHQTNELGFAGRAIYAGSAPCDGLSHGARPEIFNLLLRFAPEALNDDMMSELAPHCPTSDFPTHDSFAHEQYSAADLQRAHEGGMRLMVNYTSNNAMICTILAGYDRGEETSCRDHPNIDRQVLATWDFAKAHDWYQIALDPIDAAAAVERGQLAVLIGVEASDYFAAHRFRGGILGSDAMMELRHRRPVGKPRLKERRRVEARTQLPIPANFDPNLK